LDAECTRLDDQRFAKQPLSARGVIMPRHVRTASTHSNDRLRLEHSPAHPTSPQYWKGYRSGLGNGAVSRGIGTSATLAQSLALTFASLQYRSRKLSQTIAP